LHTIGSYYGNIQNVLGKIADLYTISNIRGAERTNNALKAFMLKNIDVTGKLADVGKYAKNAKGNFRGVSLGNSSSVSKVMKVSEAAGAIGIGITWGEEAITTGKNYGKILASNNDFYTKGAKISSSTAGMAMRTISKLASGTVGGLNWLNRQGLKTVKSFGIDTQGAIV